MTTDDKLKILGESARYEVAGRSDAVPGVVPMAGGKSLFKVLMTNACRHNCAFCPAASGRDAPRAELGADELAASYNALHKTGDVHGLFLSSASSGAPDEAMAPMLDALHILRERHGYEGYVHLKVLPGASDDAIRAAVTSANRVSVNLDTPNAARMACVDAGKDWDADVAGTLRRVRAIAQETREAGNDAADVATALVVGASGETDREILSAMGRCYEEWDVKRVHFGRFQPVGGTAMETEAETPAIRVRRLYETDYLVRRYGFALDEFTTQPDGNLDPDTDPKVAVAKSHPNDFPVDVTTAPREMLLRVPGIGELSTRRILRARAENGVRDAGDLRAMGVVVGRAAPFLTISGRAFAPPISNPRAARRREAGQLALFG